MQHKLLIEYGDEVLLGTGLSEAEFDAEAKFLLAAKLFELGKLSSGRAAILCGKGRVEFLLSLERIGVSMSNLHPEDVEAELKFIRRD